MNHIRQYREAAGLTQAELGAAVGSSQQQIGRFEAERRRLTAEVARRIAVRLGVTVERLLTGEETAPSLVPARPQLRTFAFPKPVEMRAGDEIAVTFNPRRNVRRVSFEYPLWRALQLNRRARAARRLATTAKGAR